MVVMPDALYSEQVASPRLWCQHTLEQVTSLDSKIMGIAERAGEHEHLCGGGVNSPLLKLAVERDVANEFDKKSGTKNAVGLHLQGESFEESVFGYLRAGDYGAAVRSVNAGVIAPLLDRGYIRLEARMKLEDGKKLINGTSKQNVTSGGSAGETGGVPCLLLVSKGPNFEQALSGCNGESDSDKVRKGLVRLISQLRRPQGLAHLKLVADTSLCTAVQGRSGKSWYEYRYASSSLGTLSRSFLRKFAWAVGGAAGQNVGETDDAGSQVEDYDDDREGIWAADSYRERAVVHQPGDDKQPEEREKLVVDPALDWEPVLSAAPMETGESEASQEIYEETEMGRFPPMKVVWPSDQQMKGYDEKPAESEGSQPQWLTEENRGDAGMRIRSSFMLTGSDKAFDNVKGEIEAQRGERQFGRDAALSHSKVLSCHLCYDEDADDDAAARSMDSDGGRGATYDNEGLVWVYVGSANFSQAAWGGPLAAGGSTLTKKEREAQAGSMDTHSGVHALPWWGKNTSSPLFLVVDG